MPKLSSTPLVILSAVLAFTLHCGAQETAGAQAGPAHAHNRVSAATFPRQRNGQPGRDAAPAAAQAAAQNPATSVDVDASSNRHAINPNIYGIAYGDAHDMAILNAPLNRWGGDATSRYNWQIDGHSAGADWYFETYSDGSGAPGGSADAYVSTTRSAGNGAEPMFTIPMIDYLANLGPDRSTLEGFSVKKYGAQQSTDPWNSDAGNGVSASAGNDITGNDPLDTGVSNSAAIQQAWVQHFVKELGPATATTGIKYYILDNEPSLWYSTHRDVHPSPATYDELFDKIVTYATAIRAADPTAKIAGLRGVELVGDVFQRLRSGQRTRPGELGLQHPRSHLLLSVAAAEALCLPTADRNPAHRHSDGSLLQRHSGRRRRFSQRAAYPQPGDAHSLGSRTSRIPPGMATSASTAGF